MTKYIVCPSCKQWPYHSPLDDLCIYCDLRYRTLFAILAHRKRRAFRPVRNPLNLWPDEAAA